MMPKRVQRKRTKGWRMPANTVYVGRGSKWGNPFVAGKWCAVSFSTMKIKHFFFVNTKQQAVDLYPDLIKNHTKIKSLKGKNLACWCPLDQTCHADVLLELANK